MTASAPPPDPSSQSPGGRFTWIGLSIVTAIAAMSLALLASQRRTGSGTPPPAVDAAAFAAAAADARFDPERWYLPDEELLGFVAIPAGPFVMGSDRASDPLAFDNERLSPTTAQGHVELPEFYMARYEVTAAQFLTFANASRYRLDSQVTRQPDARPVTFVSWPDALAYARWLNTTLAASAATPAPLKARLSGGWLVTLPSEAEWEKAARNGDGRRYPWGGEPRRDRAIFATTQPAPVGSLPCPECAYGLADMSGNVWEWTRSPYRAFADGTAASLDLRADALWVMRGGSYADGEQTIRAATRGGADPGVRRGTIGFRVAITPPANGSR